MRVFVKYLNSINSFNVTVEDVALIEKVKLNKPALLDTIKVNNQDELFVLAKQEDALFLLELILRVDISNLFDVIIDDNDVDSDIDFNEPIDILRPERFAE